jgi:hypothetical protein
MKPKHLFLLTFALAASGCVPESVRECPPAPKLPPVPASIMVKPTYEAQIRSIWLSPELSQSLSKPTPMSQPASKPTKP